MSNKLIIAKPGFNVLTETNPDNLIFSSDYGTLKYYTSGSIVFNITIDRLDYITSSFISHNLGYAPFFESYVLGWNSNYQPAPLFFQGASTTTKYDVIADANKLYFRVQMTGFTIGNTYTVTFYYFLFKNNTGLI